MEDKQLNDIEYLRKIAEDNRPAKRAEVKIGKMVFDKKILILIGGAMVAVILMMILGGILSGLGTRERDQMDRIYFRTLNLNTAIEEYKGRVKSSELRSMGQSLSGVLVETSSKVSSLLTSEYGAADVSVPQSEETLTEETEHLNELTAQLTYGRLNGFMDRYFAREFTKEIALLMALEGEVIEGTSYDDVRAALSTSRTNLNQLYGQFSGFSDIAN